MAATPYFPNLMSADSHVMEPYDIWWKAIGQQFDHRTPRLLDGHQGQPGTFFYSGNLGAPVTPVRDLLPTSDAAATAAADKGFGASGYLPEVAGTVPGGGGPQGGGAQSHP